MEELYWLWLSLAVSPGSHSFKKLLNKFKTVEEIYKAADKMINSAIDPKSSDRAALIDKNLDKATEVRDFCKKMNIGIVTYGDELYPDSLRKIPNPPVLLYYRGKLPKFNDYVSLSVVGTRYPTSYGRKNAFELSYDLAKAGALIVSGMAIGVDGVAHASAIAAGMPTVAVLGCGINICYPKIHLSLAREEDAVAMNFLGFDIVLPGGMTKDRPHLRLVREGRYFLELGESEQGAFVRVENYLEKLAEHYRSMKDALAVLKDKHTSLKDELAKTEDYTQLIETLRTRIERLDKKLGVAVS